MTTLLRRERNIAESLAAARTLAESVRFAGDKRRANGLQDSAASSPIRCLFLENALQITREVTPVLFEQLNSTCRRLKIPGNCVEAFVSSSKEVQAECFAGSSTECVVHLTSSLIDLLDEEEFEFVLGHELGHFLLGHVGTRSIANSLEDFMQQRAQEISVDRIGLSACGSLNVAIRALMKTASGLTSRHLRFDVATFVSQLEKSNTTQFGTETASHPSIIVRCRALLWFSMIDTTSPVETAAIKRQRITLDRRIDRDFAQFVDGPARRRIGEAKKNLALWMVTEKIVNSGSFEKTKQRIVAEIFGIGDLEKLKVFLGNLSPAEAREAVIELRSAAHGELQRLAPNRFSKEMTEIENTILSRF